MNPRVAMLAKFFRQTVTATAVWLNARGVDLTLTTYHACRIDSGEIVLTVSQPYPVRDMAHFEAAPKTEGASAVVNSYPEIPWAPDEMTVFAEVVANNPMALAITNHLKEMIA